MLSFLSPVVLALAVLLASAWSGAARAQQLPLRYLTQQDGLGNLAINALAQDQTGYLWVGTDNGLFRYNGAEFRRFGQAEGMTGTQVTGVLSDRRQRLWVATSDGVYLRKGERLVPVTKEGETFFTIPGQPLADGPDDSVLVVSTNQLLRLSEAGGKVDARLFFSREERQRRPALDQLLGVMVDRDGRLWMGCDKSLCVAGAGGVGVRGAADGVPDDDWLNLLRAADGTLWARGAHHVIALEPGAERFIDRTPPGDVMRKATMATALVEDADGRVLINVDHGLARWATGRWQFLGAANGLKMGGGVPAMLVDRDQGLWLGTGGHGLVRWMGYDNWENWGGAQGLPDDMVFAFLRDGEGRMRIGTRSGLAMLAGPNATRALPVPGYPAEQWNSMALDHQGNLWTSSYVGSLMREDAHSGAVTQVATMPMIFKLLVDRRGRLWISTGEGLYVIERPESGATPSLPAGLPVGSGLLTAQTRRSCEGADGTLWFMTADTLWRLREGRWDSYALAAAGAPEFDSMACAADGALWLGQVTGVLWRAEVGERGLVKRAQSVPLLRDKNLTGIHEDGDGWLWLTTDAGLLVWNRHEWRQFDSSDGLVWNGLNARPVYEEVDGTLWLASANGASQVKRPGRLFAPYAMSAIVEAAERDGRALTLRDGDALPWSAGSLNFTMASLSYQHREALRFRYRLAGLETEWTTTAVPRLRYAALPPGQYRLQYAVENVDSQSKSEVRELRFTILPPWWLSNGFFLLCALVAMFALWQLYRYRVRGLRRHNAEMESLVRARTSELEARTRELELSQEALRERALRDGLTKAWNRVAMLEMMDQAILKGQRHGSTFLLCLLDLDHFKRINDTHGHLAGDAVLRELVPRLGEGLRAYDLVGRYGGEEFLVLLTDLSQATGAGRVEAMRAAVAATPFDIGEGRTLAVTASFGVAEFDPAHPAAGLELVRRADLALYRAKQRGRNRVEFAGPGDYEA
ncbi:diguanylate cyclase (GGDEF)-like protein [Duganella sp. 1411]|uniref:ligand-binding sensor domain-containing diguanylate cyclase n=1 Tax=Duganella sp. 1411 TaxID=2806572 RepID=UPI001AE2A930|nr:diguanylate cyclase [Duganella sp. 1411]MBP1203567.1 diguanylate cyclase (GGDEF)-like protein [Duganella sp. 1411]